METSDAKIKALINDPASLTTDELRELNRCYPCFPLAAVTLLEHHVNELSDSETAALRLHLAVITKDKKALFDILGERAESFAAIYPPAPPKSASTTENVIDTFFANYGSADPAETELIERMIFNPIPSDYSEQMLAGDDSSSRLTPEEDSLESRIDAFVRDHSPEPEKPSAAVITEKPRHNEPQRNPASAPSKADDSLLSESLAKIFIKQGRYERAYEIISNLSLNYPKKSIYFADQLRFLQKLILIKKAAEAKDS
ncbi:MAG: hypothetical protein K2J12_09360 [Muribaculaceae bacterium]|nr:hypothetical protein [Muribaculaceae bacterium]